MEAEKLKPPLNDCGNKKDNVVSTEKSGLFLYYADGFSDFSSDSKFQFTIKTFLTICGSYTRSIK